MTYSIFDSGNLVASFESEDEAQAALERVAAEDTAARERILLVAFDDAGNVISECAPGERIADRV